MEAENYFYLAPLYRTSIFIISMLILAILGYKNFKNLKLWIQKIFKQQRAELLEAIQLGGDHRILTYYDLLYGMDNAAPELLEKAKKNYQEIDYQNNFSPIYQKKSLFILLARTILTGLFLVLIFRNESSLAALRRIIHFNQKFAIISDHQIKLTKKMPYLIQGDTLSLKAKITGKLPANVYFNYREENLKNFSQVSSSIDLSDSTISGYLENPESNMELFFSSKKTTSDTLQVEFLKRPFISQRSISITPPAYTKENPREITEVLGDILVIKGSHFETKIFPNTKIDSGFIYISENDSIKNYHKFKLNQKNNYFSYQKNILEPFSYYFKIYKNHSKYGIILENQNPVIQKIDILEDEKPVLTIVSPEDYYQIKDQQSLPLTVVAGDDYGITSMNLYLKKVLKDSVFAGIKLENPYENFQKYPLAMKKMGDDRYYSSSYFDLTFLKLMNGDKIEYFVRVLDNDSVSGYKFSDSKTYTATLPTLESLLEESDESYTQQDQMMKQSRKQNESLKEKIKKLTNNLKANKNIDWEKKQQIEEMLKENDQMRENIENLNEEMKKNIEKMSENALLSEETMEKYKKLQNLIDEVLSNSLKEKLEKLSALNKDQDLTKEKMNDFLENFEQKQEEFSKQMDKMIDIMKQIKQEFAIDKTLKHLQESIDLEDKFLKNLDQEEKDHSNLAKNITDLKKELKKSNDAYQEMKEAFKDDKNLDPKELNDLEKSLSEKTNNQALENIKEDLKKENYQQASQKSFRQRQDLNNAYNKLSDLKDKMLQKQKEKLSEDIKKEIYNIIYLSLEAEELVNQTKAISNLTIKYPSILKNNMILKEGFNLVSGSIFEISSKTFFIEEKIAIQIGKILKDLEITTGLLAKRRIRKITKNYKQMMHNLNLLAIYLNTAKENLDKSNSPSGLKEMLEKLEKMAQQQQELNQQTESMMQMQQSGNNSMLSKLAQQQMALSKAMSQMMQEMGMQSGQGSFGNMPGSQQGGKPQGGNPSENGENGMSSKQGKKGKSSLGRKLSEMGGSMQDIANQMKDKRLDQSLLKKQKKLLEKMLETVKSEKKEKFSKQRESKSSDIKALDPGKIDIFETSLYEKLIRSLRDGYNKESKKKIKEYFRNLEK